MRVIIPVKALRHAKKRLADVLTAEQRPEFVLAMLADVLTAIRGADMVTDITVVTSDRRVMVLADSFAAQALALPTDSGYSEDAMAAVMGQATRYAGKIAVIPTDVPQLTADEVQLLAEVHRGGLTLCPAAVDGGTNGLVFSPPLPLPLMFGPNSLKRYEAAARAAGIAIQRCPVAGLQRDIDRPADLDWLQAQPTGGAAWAYLRQHRT